MATSPPRNPFVIGRLATGVALADRTAEVARLELALTDVDRRLVYYGDRRMGKSSAVEEAAIRARKRGRVVAVADLNVATGSDDAARRVLDAVYREIGAGWRASLERVASAVKATVSWTMTPHGLPDFSFSVSMADAATSPTLLPQTLDALDKELSSRRRVVGLAIDEFQRLFRWGGDNAGWALKHAIERHTHIAYALTGSSRTLIGEFLKDRTRGLWKAVDALEFGPIPDAEFVHWMRARAKATGVTLDVEPARAMLRVAGPRTRDVVQLARQVWDLATTTRKPATVATVASAFDVLVAEQAPLHDRLWQQLPRTQQRALMVLAGVPGVAITASDTLERFELGAKSTVARSLELLTKDEVLHRREQGEYVFEDPYYRRWVQLYAVPDLGVQVPGADPGVDESVACA
jgi:AAA+ ATPase superfamily predicted ATPase